MEQRNTFMLLGLLSGVVYAFFGILTILTFFGVVSFALISADVLTGLMILIVGIVFIEGAKELRESVSDAIPFLMVGILLAGVIAGLQIAILFSNALGWLLALEDWTDWQVASDFTQAIWVFPAVVPLLVAMYPFSKRVVKKPKEVK
ncbi:MAG: hypothetical protein KGY80_08485 [Candidatus Thorarchaeota archaeon]|nr:hypothetical protein [Candidatus Thorarchaeota archaeon]